MKRRGVKRIRRFNPDWLIICNKTHELVTSHDCVKCEHEVTDEGGSRRAGVTMCSFVPDCSECGSTGIIVKGECHFKVLCPCGGEKVDFQYLVEYPYIMCPNTKEYVEFEFCLLCENVRKKGVPAWDYTHRDSKGRPRFATNCVVYCMCDPLNSSSDELNNVEGITQ